VVTATFAQAQEPEEVERLSDKQLRQRINYNIARLENLIDEARAAIGHNDDVLAELNARIEQAEATEPPTDPVDPPVEPPVEPPVVTDGLAVMLTFPSGEVLSFSQEDARCFENWVGENFSQANCRASDGFWHVSFRPDTTSDRIEVVVELGHVTNDVDAPFTSTGYNFALTKDGETIAEESIPFHFWGGRWRWQSEERPILKSCADIADDPFLPQLEKATLGHDPGVEPVYSGPFTMPEFARGMGNGGERQDIGVVTGWSASCLLGGAMTEEHLIALAADYSAVPVHHFRLPTGEMLDITQEEFKNHNFHSSSKGQPSYIAMEGVSSEDYPTFVKRDTAHHPSLFYIPFLLTGDPFWLEELQYVTQGHLLSSNWDRNNNDAGQHLAILKGQMRGFAWGYRDVLHAHYLTPENAPDWLHSKAYYDKLLDDVLVELNAIMNDTGSDTRAIQRQRFNIMWSNSGWLTAMWMQDFNVSVWGLGVRAGYEQFRPWFEWLLVSANERTKDNGWDQRVPSFYNVDNRVMDFTAANNWSELFPVWRSAYPDRFSDQWPEGSYWATRDQYSGYAEYVYGGLVVAEWLGYDVPGLDYLDNARAEKEALGAKKTYDKWSFQR